jgi:hypothetical protein
MNRIDGLYQFYKYHELVDQHSSVYIVYLNLISVFVRYQHLDQYLPNISDI